MNVLLSPDAPAHESRWCSSPLPPNPRPQQDAAPVAHPHAPADGEQRSPGIAIASEVSQLLDVYDDVVAVADCLQVIMRWHVAKTGDHPRFRAWMDGQEKELRAVATDIADICAELVPGAPAARDYHFTAYLDPFEPPPLPGGSELSKPVSQTANTCSSRADE